MATTTAVASPTASAPPLDLSKALPYLTAAYRFSASALASSARLSYRLSKSTALLLHTSFFSHLVAATLYLCAPAIVFVSLILQAFVLAPYRTVAWVLELVYPVYVLVGVACIVGGIVGGVARLGAQFAVDQCVVREAEVGPANGRVVGNQQPRKELKSR
ncbi:hypothetical protein BD626DRAFT_554543 [Schizophyllum amplum]|uniref:Uncharacterized protein n=1 Tax=Schizophyllum amplum TaxID=97359 RepID=A0A550D0K6_9AGAR|nr:hypothetical protein BD626DRAFT_554543 [Auriculariopsis ampla]